MPSYGSPTGEIFFIGDYPDRHGDGWGFIASHLSRLGFVSNSFFFTTLSEKSPPTTPAAKNQPDPDAWLSSRKTCPGPGWEFFGENWLHPDLSAGRRRVQQLIAEYKPRIVVPIGKLALAAIYGTDSIAKWRGSRISTPTDPYTIIPLLHPRSLTTQPEQNFLFPIDISRVTNVYTYKQKPRVYDFLIKPSFDEAVEYLAHLLSLADDAQRENRLLKLSGDLETRLGHIACFGIAYTAEKAVCIPHLVTDTAHEHFPHYWTVEEETLIVSLYQDLFTHPAVLWVGQNYLYDCQYFERHWGILPLRVRDTMIGAHSLHSNIRKGLDFLSSLYAHDHVYWKDEIKEWDGKIGERQYWTYNCKDACIAWEIDDEIVKDGKARA